MKKLMLLGLALVAALTFTACKKEGGTPQDTVAKIDTSSVQKAFESAPADVRTDFERALAAIQSGNAGEAVSFLKKLSENARLTPEQKDAIAGLMSKVQGAAVEGANNAINEVKEALPK